MTRLLRPPVVKLIRGNLYPLTILLILIGMNCVTPTDGQLIDEVPGRKALDNFPLIDGHNDLPWILFEYKRNQLKNVNLQDVSNDKELTCVPCQHTDIRKMRFGKIGAQFWAAYVTCETQYRDAGLIILEQIDLIKRITRKYSKEFEFVTTADGILEAFRNGKIASLIGIEGGHALHSKLSALRSFYELGVRYMTLTHSCDTPWADSSPLDTSSVHNLTEFGKKVVLEMNRLGMMVDISHVSYNTMKAVLDVTKVPVIFSHSSSYSIHPHHRNVRDDILEKLKSNGGIVMVNFYNDFVGVGNVTVMKVLEHINHIVGICGVDCVGIGADYGGVDRMPIELENVSKYPGLFNLLKKMDPELWTINNLEKLAGRNLIRVFKAVEKARDELVNEEPLEDWITDEDLTGLARQCVTKLSF